MYMYLQGRSQDFGERGAIVDERGRKAPKFGWPEATPLINEVIINLYTKLGMGEHLFAYSYRKADHDHKREL